MVKSRRSASFRQSRPKRTLAWRPKVSTSSRSVVTSNGRPSITTVTVPCSMPVGTGLKPAAAGAADHLVGNGGGGDIDLADRLAEQRVAHRAADHARLLAVAIEHREQPRQRALAQPGAHRRAAAARRSPRYPSRDELAVLDMRPARRSSPAARRRNAPRYDEAADHQQQRDDGERREHLRGGQDARSSTPRAWVDTTRERAHKTARTARRTAQVSVRTGRYCIPA